MKTDLKKTEALKSWSITKNVKNVHAFLGFTGYYGRFIKNFASKARPLNDHFVIMTTNNTKKGKNSAFFWKERQ